MSQDCIFCKIVSKQLSAQVVYENETTLAFSDLSPVASTHVLVVPKEHIDNAATLESHQSVVVGQMMMAAQEVAKLQGVFESGYRLVFNVGRDGGNTVGHLHMHVIGGQALGWPPFSD